MSRIDLDRTLHRWFSKEDEIERIRQFVSSLSSQSLSQACLDFVSGAREELENSYLLRVFCFFSFSILRHRQIFSIFIDFTEHHPFDPLSMLEIGADDRTVLMILQTVSNFIHFDRDAFFGPFSHRVFRFEYPKIFDYFSRRSVKELPDQYTEIAGNLFTIFEKHERLVGTTPALSYDQESGRPSERQSAVQQEQLVDEGAYINIFGTVLWKKKGPKEKGKYSPPVFTESFKHAYKSFASTIAANSPVILEGSSGIGKSTLIESLSHLLNTQPIYLTIADKTDGKDLIGSYVCTEVPGQFKWENGPLTTAIKEGRWIVFEDIETAPMEILNILVPVLQSRKISIPGTGETIHAAFGFHMISKINNMSILLDAKKNFFENLWTTVKLREPSREELIDIVSGKFPRLAEIADVLVENYLAARRVSPISMKHLAMLCRRILLIQDEKFEKNLSKDTRVAIFEFTLSCYGDLLPPTKREVLLQIADESRQLWNLSDQEAFFIINDKVPEITMDPGVSTRYLRLEPVTSNILRKKFFALTRNSTVLIEKLVYAIYLREPILLVGETGTGKTSIVQFISNTLGIDLVVQNLNQQSESSDLIGGFKPIQLKLMFQELTDEFVSLFSKAFNLTKNTKYINYLRNAYEASKWQLLIKTFRAGIMKVKELGKYTPSWKAFEERLEKMDGVSSAAFAFSFVDGTLIKAMKEGQWILLDEINLASIETLQILTNIMRSTKSGKREYEMENGRVIKIHDNFRIFACMNPPTDVGKRDLSENLKAEFSIFQFAETENKDDINLIISGYLPQAGKDLVSKISSFYLSVRALQAERKITDSSFRPITFSLRTLCRSLEFANVTSKTHSLERSLKEGIVMTFTTLLSPKSKELVVQTMKETIGGTLGQDEIPFERMLPVGRFPIDECKWFVQTDTIKKHIRNLARVISVGHPVLLQGPTSSGKTSLVEYISKITGHKYVRINNHEQTDISEYLGTHHPNAQGHLEFVDGVLVEAVRNGYWIVLDELNLAPTEVLEALNRLLDDNKELFIPETQETVKPHPDFMLFATQNPPNTVYGGRKQLSRAFRNRFIELFVDEIPESELVYILTHRYTNTQGRFYEGFAKMMVNVMSRLRNQRFSSRAAFRGKNLFMTPRDLFRWAQRNPGTYQELADEGYFLIAERLRTDFEKEIVKQTIFNVFGSKIDKIDPSHRYRVTDEEKEACRRSPDNNINRIVWTDAMERLFYLVKKCLDNNEPVLLVGETGTGKTTIFQILSYLRSQNLRILNCHQNTETSDFIGGMRPKRNRSIIQQKILNILSITSPEEIDRAAAEYIQKGLDESGELRELLREHKILFEWEDGSLVKSMKDGSIFLLDEISLAEDSVLERLNSVLDPNRTITLAEKGSGDEATEIIAHPSFRLVATQNPGGDFGKRELSPALRNRFTEIYVPAITSREDITKIIRNRFDPRIQDLTGVLVDFIMRLFENQRKYGFIISLREVLTWVQFLNLHAERITRENRDYFYCHGACLTFLDGIQKKEIQDLCRREISEVLGNVEVWKEVDSSKALIEDCCIADSTRSFVLERRKSSQPVRYVFTAETTNRNLLRIIRGLQMYPKPILLEGPPGVGKTSIVMSLAKLSGHSCVRINLSEQTDMMDLLGSDLPSESENGGQFEIVWRDGLFLDAMKTGKWVVLDELNLANQSVLEGLNSVFDHRREIFIPELGKTFKMHPDFRIFGCQNPVTQGGGRKGLPKSFLNRFTRVTVFPFAMEDLMKISAELYPGIDKESLKVMIEFNNRMLGIDSSFDFNLRDILRWCELVTTNGQPPEDFVHHLYYQRFRTEEQRAECMRIKEEMFGDKGSIADDIHVTPKRVSIGGITVDRSSTSRAGLSENLKFSKAKKEYGLIYSQIEYLSSILLAVKHNYPVLLVGDTAVGKTSMVTFLSQVTGNRLLEFSMNDSVDTTELLGGFEQFDKNRHRHRILLQLHSEMSFAIEGILMAKDDLRKVSELLEAFSELKGLSVDAFFMETPSRLDKFIRRLRRYSKDTRILDSIDKTLRKVRGVLSNGTQSAGNFEWVDGLLIEAIQNGYWFLIENVNFCNPTVLDRLNPLLEIDGELVVNEKGLVNGEMYRIKPHPNFRMFMTYNPKNGEISRAMKNRALEIFVPSHLWTVQEMSLMCSSYGITDFDTQKYLINTHLNIISESKKTVDILNSQFSKLLSLVSEKDHVVGNIQNEVEQSYGVDGIDVESLNQTTLVTQFTKPHFKSSRSFWENSRNVKLHSFLSYLSDPTLDRYSVEYFVIHNVTPSILKMLNSNLFEYVTDDFHLFLLSNFYSALDIDSLISSHVDKDTWTAILSLGLRRIGKGKKLVGTNHLVQDIHEILKLVPKYLLQSLVDGNVEGVSVLIPHFLNLERHIYEFPRAELALESQSTLFRWLKFSDTFLSVFPSNNEIVKFSRKARNKRNSIALLGERIEKVSSRLARDFQSHRIPGKYLIYKISPVLKTGHIDALRNIRGRLLEKVSSQNLSTETKKIVLKLFTTMSNIEIHASPDKVPELVKMVENSVENLTISADETVVPEIIRDVLRISADFDILSFICHGGDSERVVRNLLVAEKFGERLVNQCIPFKVQEFPNSPVDVSRATFDPILSTLLQHTYIHRLYKIPRRALLVSRSLLEGDLSHVNLLNRTGVEETLVMLLKTLLETPHYSERDVVNCVLAIKERIVLDILSGYSGVRVTSVEQWPEITDPHFVDVFRWLFGTRERFSEVVLSRDPFSWVFVGMFRFALFLPKNIIDPLLKYNEKYKDIILRLSEIRTRIETLTTLELYEHGKNSVQSDIIVQLYAELEEYQAKASKYASKVFSRDSSKFPELCRLVWELYDNLLRSTNWDDIKGDEGRRRNIQTTISSIVRFLDSKTEFTDIVIPLKNSLLMISSGLDWFESHAPLSPFLKFLTSFPLSKTFDNSLFNILLDELETSPSRAVPILRYLVITANEPAIAVTLGRISRNWNRVQRNEIEQSKAQMKLYRKKKSVSIVQEEEYEQKNLEKLFPVVDDFDEILDEYGNYDRSDSEESSTTFEFSDTTEEEEEEHGGSIDQQDEQEDTFWDNFISDDDVQTIWELVSTRRQEVTLRMIYDLHAENLRLGYTMLLDDKYLAYDDDLKTSLYVLVSSQLYNVSNIDIFSDDRQKDFYRDTNLLEAISAQKPLLALRSRVAELSTRFPHNESLKRIEQVIAKILDFSVDSPLMRYLLGLELLLKVVQPWEDNASKKYSLRSITSTISELLMRWRKLERDSWKTILKTKEREASLTGKRFFISLLALCQLEYDSNEQILESLFKNIELVISSSHLGEFQSILDAVSLAVDFAVDPRVKNLLQNIVSYYAQFSDDVQEEITTQRATIDKKMETFDILAKWKDNNYYRLKESIDKSHRQLNKFSLAYAKVLKIPLHKILLQKESAVTHPERARPNQQVKSRFARFLSALKKVKSSENADVSSKYASKMPKFVDKIRNFLDSVVKGKSSFVEELQVQIIDESARLRKEKKMKSVKKRALTMLFRKLREEGLVHRDETRLGELGEYLMSASNSSDDRLKYYEGYYFRCLYKMQIAKKRLLSGGVGKGDISTAELERSKIIVHRMFVMTSEQRVALSDATKEFERLGELHARLKEVLVSGTTHRPLITTEDFKKQEAFRRKLSEFAKELLVLRGSNKIKSEWLDFSTKLLTAIQDTLANLNTYSQEPTDPLPLEYSSMLLQDAKKLRKVLDKIRERPKFGTGLTLDNVLDELVLLGNESVLDEDSVNRRIPEPLVGFQDVLETAKTQLLLGIQRLVKSISHMEEGDWSIERTHKWSMNVLASFRPGQVLKSVEPIVMYQHQGDVSSLEEFSFYLEQYLSALGAAVSTLWKFSAASLKLENTLLDLFNSLYATGFCGDEDEDMEEGGEGDDGDGDGKVEFTDGVGMGEGDGVRDVTDQIENDDQMEGVRNEDEKNEQQDLEGDHGFEMEEYDFDAALEDVEKKEEDEEDEEESTSGDHEEFDDEDAFGDEQIDERLWDEEDDERNENENEETPIDEKSTAKAENKELAGLDQSSEDADGGDDDAKDDNDDVASDQEDGGEEDVELYDEINPDIQNEGLKGEESGAESDGESSFELSSYGDDNEVSDDEGTDVDDLVDELDLAEEEEEIEHGDDDSSSLADGDPDTDDSINTEDRDGDGEVQIDENVDDLQNDQPNIQSFAGNENEDNQDQKDGVGSGGVNLDAEETDGGGDDVDQEDDEGDDADEVGGEQKDNSGKEQVANNEQENIEREIGEIEKLLFKKVQTIEMSKDEADAQEKTSEEGEQEDGTYVYDDAGDDVVLEDDEPEEDEESDNHLDGEEIRESAAAEEERNMYEEEGEEDEDEEQDGETFSGHRPLSTRRDELFRLLDEYRVQRVDDERESSERSKELYLYFYDLIQEHSMELTRQLQIVLEPTKATRLKGDYKTGKRINMKKVIPYIASQFKKDKIWMRRTRPSKRNFQVLFGIDNSESMKEKNAGNMALESLFLISNSLFQIEAGETAIVSFGQEVRLLHGFDRPFVGVDAGPRIIEEMTFDEKETKMDQFLRVALNQFELGLSLNVGSRNSVQICFIISDGIFSSREEVENILAYGVERGIIFIFIVLDETGKKNSILDLKTIEYVDGKMTISEYMSHFPFQNYIVLRKTSDLPDVLSEVLRELMAIVTGLE